MNSDLIYDIIGDIHGHAQTLKALLEKIGYTYNGSSYAHPKRQVVFLGDFIDRGPQQRETLEIVMTMVNQGAAVAVMGNHEFNALGFHTSHPQKKGTWLRPRNDVKIKQHCAFLSEYLGNPKELQQVLDFFWKLPLFLDITTNKGSFRAVHACWDTSSINNLKEVLTPHNTFKETRFDTPFLKANTKGTKENDAIEILLKGPELTIPNQGYFSDKDGYSRTELRVKWWDEGQRTLSDIRIEEAPLFTKDGNLLDSHTITLSTLKEYQNLPLYRKSEKPLFVGHYWKDGAITPFAPNIACLDYSVAKEGKLVSYSWNGEKTIDNNHFNFIEVIR